ncbi:MAG: alpha-N-acetylglucosaminidase [Clostridia bacterium]
MNDIAIKTVYEMVQRNFGAKCSDFFSLNITKDNTDFFKITSENEKICVTANNGVSLAYGVYYYLKNYCHVLLSQKGVQNKMPSEIVYPKNDIYKKTKLKLRYAYNYCTHSYTMAFWNEQDWQKELDFLAFHGVNLVLDITGEEKVWFEFFKAIGFTEEKSRELLVGPAYFAWFCMGNMYNYCKALPNEYLNDRVLLAKKNHEFMKKLGMTPVFMGYSGMIPLEITKIDKEIEIIPQGKWCEFDRPAMIKTDTKSYEKYAKLFYKIQRDILGSDTNYFSTDPFHEGGTSGSLTNETVATNILKALKKEGDDNIWIVQSWGDNPTSGLLDAAAKFNDGSSKDSVIILDLYAEKNPHYKDFRGKEFQNTPWIYCMLDNFGGRIGLHGNIDNINNDLPDAINTANFLKGVGITPEGSDTNALLTEFLFDIIWSENDKTTEINLYDYLENYLYSRYGIKSNNAFLCYKILVDTVFKTEFNNIVEGAPESIVNAIPDFEIEKVSFWGNSKIGYDKEELKKAYDFLIKDYDDLKDSDYYLFDIVDIKKQILANTAIDLHEKLTLAYKNHDLETFKTTSDEFLKLILEIDSLLSTRPEFKTENFINMAKNISSKYDELTKREFILNARKLISTWGDRINAEKGCLRDYSNRQWSGITKELYYKRWEVFIKNRLLELENKPPLEEDYFKIENEWANNI